MLSNEYVSFWNSIIINNDENKTILEEGYYFIGIYGDFSISSFTIVVSVEREN